MRDESTLPTVLRRNLPPNLEEIRRGPYDKDHKDYAIHLYLKENDIRVNEEGSDIIEFLRGKNVLVTGATGFLGKVLVEKLLRCCKDIGKIFIILRTKKGKDPQVRIAEYLDNWIFYKLSQIHPDYKEKVVGISGDFEQVGIGLSEEARTTLRDQVNIIYHGAATVRFDEKLKKAVRVNLGGTQEIIKLAKECKQLDVFLYMGTAFSNCHEKLIKEEFYQPHLDPYKLMKVVEELPDDVIDRITPELIGSSPNTYAFTKQISEEIMRREAIGLPTCIHRPSIVIASVNEPIKSWVDNIFGPVGLIQGAASGLFHVMLGIGSQRCDMVPVDYVVNNCIATSYKIAKDRQLDKIPIYNYTSAVENPLYWQQLGIAGDHGYKAGSKHILMKGFFRFTRYYYWFWILQFLLHKVPAIIIDFVAVLLGKKPQLRVAFKKIDKFIKVLTHFTLNEWSFEYTNTTDLWNDLNEIDKKYFPFDMKLLNWPNYLTTYLVALREILMGEFLDNLEEGRRLRLRADVIFYVVVTSIVVLSVYFLLNTIFFFIPVTIITVICFYLFTDYR